MTWMGWVLVFAYGFVPACVVVGATVGAVVRFARRGQHRRG